MQQRLCVSDMEAFWSILRPSERQNKNVESNTGRPKR